jgi:hypothetical protein
MTFKDIIAILVILLGIPLLIVWLNDKLFHRRPSKKELDEYSKRYNQRLLNPDFAALEFHFGCPILIKLKDLYANKEEIQRRDFEVLTKKSDGSEATWSVALYEPADLESLRDAWPDCKELFAFANDGCGNDYLIDPRKPLAEVLFYDHEGGEFVNVGLTLAEFITAPRRSA